MVRCCVVLTLLRLLWLRNQIELFDHSKTTVDSAMFLCCCTATHCKLPITTLDACFAWLKMTAAWEAKVAASALCDNSVVYLTKAIMFQRTCCPCYYLLLPKERVKGGSKERQQSTLIALAKSERALHAGLCCQHKLAPSSSSHISRTTPVQTTNINRYTA